jgi:hypothetical protein
MDTCEKPSLIFRISDAKRGSDIHKTLEKLMAHHNDQYNSIRESVENVFAQPVKIINTEYPQKADDSLLSSNDYLRLLSEKENGFDSAITSIIEDISAAVPRENILKSIPGYIDSINNNEQININKLDIVALTHNNDILIWLNKVPAELKSEIEVDGTQEMYDKNVVTRQALVKKVKTDFTKRFKNITETIKKEHKAKLDAELDGPIERAKLNSEKKAREYVVKNGVESLLVPQPIGTIPDAGLTDIHHNSHLINYYLGAYQRFQKAIQNIYEPVRMIYEKIINSMYEEVNKKLEKAREISQQQKRAVEEKCKEILETFDGWLIDEINGCDNSIVFEKNSDIYAKYRKQKIDEVVEFIESGVKRQNILLILSSGNNLKATFTYTGHNEVDTKYELIANIYTEFVNQLNMYPLKESGVDDFLIEKKEEMLHGQIIMHPATANKIYTTNPQIQFVYDSILLKTCILDRLGLSKTDMPYMTVRTWTSFYMPMYDKAMETLIADGICNSSKTFRDFIIQTPEETVNIIKVTTNPSSMYETIVCKKIVQQMKKIFCMMTANEEVFPRETIG